MGIYFAALLWISVSVLVAIAVGTADQVRKLGVAIVTTTGPERCRIAQRFSQASHSRKFYNRS
jgi:hypothetical protein